MDQDTASTICFDYSHNNTLTIESSGNADFTQFLFSSSFRLGKIQAGFTDIEKLEKYRLVIIGGPRESKFSPDEIKVLVEYVRKGGNLLVFHNEGGDYGTDINLSELTKFFGFTYKNNIMFDSVNFQRQQSRIIIKDFEPHPTTEGINSIVLSSACSIEKDELIASDQNITVLPLAHSSINAYCTEWDGEDWVEEMDAWKSIVAVYSKVYKGRVIGLPTVAMLSSLSSAYGFTALNNQEFIVNIFKWLLEPIDGEEGVSRDRKLITIPIHKHLLLWMEKIIATPHWDDVSDIIHFALDNFKNNYDQLMRDFTQNRNKIFEEKWKHLSLLAEIEDPLEREKKAKILEQELTMLNLSGYSASNVKEFQRILERLSEITDGKVGGAYSEEELKGILIEGQEKLELMAQSELADDSDELQPETPKPVIELPKKDKVKAELVGDTVEIEIEGKSLEDLLAELRNPSVIEQKIKDYRDSSK